MALEADYQIINGDPAEKLLAQLFDVGRMPFSQRPTFRLVLQRFGSGSRDESTAVGVRIHSLRFCYPKNSHAHLWQIDGWTVTGAIIDEYVLESYFEGEYDTRTRNGWIKLMPDPRPLVHC